MDSTVQGFGRYSPVIVVNKRLHPTDLTARGRSSRDRIARAATALMLEHGVAATTVDDVLVAADVSKSQVYHYFGDKHGLVEAVIDTARTAVLNAQQPYLSTLDSWEAISAWCDQVVRLNEQDGSALGCPIGTLAAELVASDEAARELLVDAFSTWESHLRRGLAAMLARGALQPDSDVDALATATMASLQGGLLLAKTTRSSRPLRISLDAAIIYLHTFQASPRTRRRTSTSSS
jgi:AcrR family transcriptional regulator